MLRSRRRPRYGAQACAVISAILLLISVALLYARLSLFPSHSHQHLRNNLNTRYDNGLFSNPLLSDSDDDSINSNGSDDKIDEHDTLEEDQSDATIAALNEYEEMQEIEQEQETDRNKASYSGYYFDHFSGVIRRAYNKRSIQDWDYDNAGFNLGLLADYNDDKIKTAFGSDDIPVDEEIRRKMGEISEIEDALLLKTGKKSSPLRQGWGEWFDKKSDFLRRDKMFKSNLEVLNPLHNPLLQDPDGVGVTGLSRGDKMMQKLLLNDIKRVPFVVKKPLGVSLVTRPILQGTAGGVKMKKIANDDEEEGRIAKLKRAKRKTLDDEVATLVISKKTNDTDVNLSNEEDLVNGSRVNDGTKMNNGLEELNANANVSGEQDGKKGDSLVVLTKETGGMKNGQSKAHESKDEFSGHIYADGRRWGYYPGLDPTLSFSDFMDAFFRKGKCKMRVFMVWNSPPWMFSVRHQRGLESLVAHHPDACVVVFSETVELDFFRDTFVKDGYKVAMVMPNLDELLKNTPTHVFASVWFEWKKTKYYATHYSELVRLAALYKFGGIYLDSDVIILNSLSLLDNSVGMEDQHAGGSLNGAVMVFTKQSPFILECLNEYYLAYDDTSLRWNGADLLTRVSKKFLEKNMFAEERNLKVQAAFKFFPISSQHITRYFTTPATEAEEMRQEALYKKILEKSLTFHFWNSLTSSLNPEPRSLVSRLIDHTCIRCSDVL